MASYVLSFEERPDHLFARVTASFDTLALAVGYWTEIATECRRRGFAQVLVVRSVRVAAPRSDTFQVAGALRDLGFGGTRVACVDQSPDPNAAATFGRALVAQRALDARAFATVELAADWLRESAAVPPAAARVAVA